VLSDYVKTEFQAMLDNMAEKRARERPIKAAKKQIKARLKNRSLSAEKKTDLLKTLEALDDIGLAKMLQDAGIAIAAVSVESTEPDPIG
jgi:proline dehydrogenase